MGISALYVCIVCNLFELELELVYTNRPCGSMAIAV